MGKDFMVVLFAMTAGITASGILANLYRLLAKKPETLAARIVYVAIMVIAGPSVLLENAAASLRAKACSKTAFVVAAAICAYWSFALGLFVLNISLAL